MQNCKLLMTSTSQSVLESNMGGDRSINMHVSKVCSSLLLSEVLAEYMVTTSSVSGCEKGLKYFRAIVRNAFYLESQ